MINTTIIQTFYSDASSKKCWFYPQWPAFTAGEIWNYVACGFESFWTMWLDMKIESFNNDNDSKTTLETEDIEPDVDNKWFENYIGNRHML